MSDDEDPFERLDESVGDREGDPFEQLGDVDADDTDEGDEAEEPSGRDPRSEPESGYDAHDVTPAGHRDELDGADERTESAEGTGTTQPGEPAIDTDGPTVRTDHGGQTVDPDDPFGDVGTRDGDPFDDDVFEEMDVGDLDPDEVWDSLSEAEERGSVSKLQERTYAEVSKHRYCEQCEFFSDPPDVKCSHDGTEILEFVDNETVRVVDCPIVAERKELEKHD